MGVPLNDNRGDPTTEEASKEHEDETARWRHGYIVCEAKVRMLLFLVLWKLGLGLFTVTPFGSGQPATYAFALGWFPKTQSRLNKLAIVGTGRRGCPSFDVRHLQKTDSMLDCRSQAIDCVFFWSSCWSGSTFSGLPVQEFSPTKR